MKLFDYVYEGGKNYIRTEEVKPGDYITEMLIHNNIDGFVGARLKSRNAENLIVYPISGFVPLTQLVEIKRFKAEEMEALIRSFIRAMRSMDEYLLPSNRLIVEPEHIYQNYGKKNEFLWIYGGKETQGGKIVHLFEFLLDKVDNRDDRAVSMVYSLYQSCKNYELLEADGASVGMLSLVCEKGEELLSAKIDMLEYQAGKHMEMENNLLREEDPVFPIKLEERRDEIEEKRSKILPKINLSTSLRAETNRNKEEKAERERQTIINKKKTSSSTKMKGIFQKAWNYLNADIGSRVEPTITIEEEMDDYKLRDVKVVKAREEGTGKATTLLTNGMVNNGLYCLKPMERGEECIFITSYPFFIGKAETDIHLKIDDSTVSRYHCRIDREETFFYLTDLGSTNGTFLNGTRMIPFERLKMEEGDYILISRKKYLFSFMN